MASDLHQRPAAGLRQWRISVDDRADVAFPLRDYFRRLGVGAEVCGPTTVELTTDAPAAELRTALADWVRVMDVPARFVEAQAPGAAAGGGGLLPPPRLGELLVRKRLIDDDQLTEGLREARETGQLLGVVLLRKQLIFEDELARTLSEQLSIPYVAIMQLGFNPLVARLLPAEVGERVAAIPVRADGDVVQVVFADPTDPVALDAVNEHLPRIQVAVAELSDIRQAWRSVRARSGSGGR